VTYPPATYALRQIPKVEGALIALDPHTGRVLAMSGGYSFARSQFNRVTQAMRQPGSSFKPILYLAALDEGYTPSSLILDAPFVIEQGPGLPKWRPENYTSEFYGPSTMRLGIEKSRNLMTVRLAQALGMDKVAEYANRLGVAKNMPKLLASSLGSIEATPMAMTAAYAVFVNGGKRINPTLIDRIQDRDGRTVFRHDNRACNGCSGIIWANTLPPNPPDNRERLTSSASAYQMVSMLQGVVERGTATSVHAVGKPLAGKTGTSNDFKDAWFIGFSPDLAVGVFVGFDGPQSLGKKETGGAVAAPIFRDFMKDALAGVEAKPFRVPPDIRLVRVNLRSGKPAKPGEKDVIWEAFKPDNVPGEGARVIEGLGASDDLDSTPSEAGGTSSAIPGSGGLY
jgi:penicillin-binding protein 1A